MKSLYSRLTLLVSTIALLSTNCQAADNDAFDMQRCVNMGNSYDAPRGEPWGKPLNADHFTLIKNKGFDTVRIPVRWSDYTGGAPDYKIESAFLDKVSRDVDAALNLDLNVILNVHHFEEIMEDPDANMKKFLSMWEQLAPHFKNRSDSLWFEVINEPFNELKGEKLLQLQGKAVRSIRKSNPNRIIILGGEDWSGIRTLDTNIMPPDANIVYTFHYYDPFDFTHQKAPWVEDGPKKKKKWGSKEDHTQLKAAVKTATDFREAVDRPLFVGEFGAYENIKNSERVEYAGDVRAAMEEAQIPWCLWSFSNTFALYDAEKEKWDEDMLSSLVPNGGKMETRVITKQDALADQQDWGTFLSYYNDDTRHTSDVLSGVAEIKPGQEIHPPHKHPEEEFLMVLEGNGTWTVGTKDFPAKAGDLLYAAPWELHGIKNTGSTPLKFFVVKYNKK